MKRAKMNNKGFTLVELIVVLVILAILAAVLVPTLLGYIDRAKSEKDYSTAQSIRVATQSIIAELYAQNTGDGILTEDDVLGSEEKILQLVGGSGGKLDGVPVDITGVTLSGTKENQILGMTIKINEKPYVLKDNVWTAGSAASGESDDEDEGEGE